MRSTIILVGLVQLWAGGAGAGPTSPVIPAAAGENLSAEAFLPLHDNRDAYTPCDVFLKDSYLVVWRSGMLAPGDLREGFKFNADIAGCRVSASGEVLSKEPFVICKADDLQALPRMAAGKECALVVWQDLRNGKDWDVYGARIAPDGPSTGSGQAKVLDPDGFVISGGPHNQGKPKVAWDGKTFVVVWQDFRNGSVYDTYAARVGADAKVLDQQGIKLTMSGRYSEQTNQGNAGYDPAICSAGDGRCFIISNGGPGWVGRNLLFVTMGFLADGVFTKAAYGGEPEGSKNPSLGRGNTPMFLASGQDGFLLSWRSEAWIGRGNGPTDCTAMILDGNGNVTARTRLAGTDHLILHGDLAWDGRAYTSAWTAYRLEMKGPDRGQLCGDSGGKFGGGQKPFERVLVSRILPDGKLAGPVQAVSGEWNSPAGNVCVASDGAGATLIAYEKHPATGDQPIRIGVRLLTAK